MVKVKVGKSWWKLVKVSKCSIKVGKIDKKW